MTDQEIIEADGKQGYIEMVAEFRKFYDENGYLPHKAALRLIQIAEELIK